MPSLSPPFPQTKPRKHFSKPPCLVPSLITFSSETLFSLRFLANKGLRLPSQTLARLIDQCGDFKSLNLVKWLHLHLKVTKRKNPSTFLANSLIRGYFKCGDEIESRKLFDKMSVRNLYSWNNMLSGYAKMGMIVPARQLFDKMPEKDVVSWNIMVIGYAKSGNCDEALRFYRELRRLGIGYNEFSFAGVLTVCVKLKELGLTRQVHGQVLVAGFVSNVVLLSSVVDSYAKCGEMGDARRLFDDMPARDVLSWTTLVSGYAKWGDMKSAREIFDQMPVKNPVSWTALIEGYARNSLGHEALELFTKMMQFRVRPDQFTFSSCLCACANIASIKHGRQIHAYIIRTNFRPNTIVVSSLIDMYSKCGSFEIGRQVFDLMGCKQDVVLWNTMISALAQHGRGKEAIQMFDDMIRSRVNPDRVTLVVILNACSHSGLVQEGLRFFEMMTCGFGIVPNQEHYACLFDLLGRAGRFVELTNQLGNMPCKPDDRVWNALLGVCRIHGNIDVGRKAAEELIKLEPQSSAAYVLLSSIYAVLGRWELVENVRQLMNKRKVKKQPAISWIELENQVHSFTVSDRMHPSKEEIYLILEQLTGQAEEDISSPDTER